VEVPAHMNAPLARALELFELKESGAVFIYPDGLTAEDWLCLRAARRAFIRWEQDGLNKPK
jgi:hypothetical protein